MLNIASDFCCSNGNKEETWRKMELYFGLFWKTLESVSGLVTGKWRLHDHCALVPFISDVRATLREKRVYRAHDNNTKYTLSHFLLTDLCSCSTARH